MLSLVLAGEAIFGLTFQVPRHFRPTFVEVFGVSQIQLGVLNSIYGIVATFSYLLGGGLADRLSARCLLAGSLVMVGLSGLYMASIPSYMGMCYLYVFWGVFTILPFWAALIRATRQWGGKVAQGRAFGLLDGGRGLLASVLAMLALFSFAQLLPDADAAATLAEKTVALQVTIYAYAGACCLAAMAVWFFIPPENDPRAAVATHGSARSSGHLLTVLRMPAVWWHTVVIAAAYSTFKASDYYSQYAADIWDWSPVEAAGLSAYSSWMRPIAALAAGLLADRLTSVRVVMGCFLLAGITFLTFVWLTPDGQRAWLLWANVLTVSFGVFALRGVYFALLEEAEIPSAMTGTAVGVVSFLGFSPEIFMPLLGGWLIDPSVASGPLGSIEMGYRVLFGFLFGVSCLGIAATWALSRQRSTAVQVEPR